MMNFNLKFLLLLLPLLLSFSSYSVDLNVIAVGEASLQKVGITLILPKSMAKEALAFAEIIENDFLFYKKDIEISKQENSDAIGTNYFLTFKLETSAKGLEGEIELKNGKSKEQLLLHKTLATKSNFRAAAHIASDLLYKKVTGKESSIFLSKIVFVSDKGSSQKYPVKELYQMDFDGNNIRQITFHRGLVIGPAVSSNGRKIVYSLVKWSGKRRNIDLYMLNLDTKQTTLLSSKPGLNSGAVFLPGDTKLALTLSFGGNADIFEMDLTTKALRPITKHYAEDVDPSMAPSGSKMAFLSDRPGKAMIYLLDPTGTEKDVTRIGFVGKYNATPRFSPDGQYIAFASWLDERFDIFRLGSDGSSLVRLTKDFGSNEDPTFSPDSEFIAFSSQRVFSREKAVTNIYIMDKDGSILGNLTPNMANCTTPRWSN